MSQLIRTSLNIVTTIRQKEKQVIVIVKYKLHDEEITFYFIEI
jgi:hypothetical protein